jgi:uncharacterized protein YqcC (DUF446 family)
MLQPDSYEKASRLIESIEMELKRLNRWSEQPLPPEKFENMGPFGSHTMAFEQWIQFVLLPRLEEIVRTQGEFPRESKLAVYAVRQFDGDPDTDNLQELLYQLDELVESIHQPSAPYQPYPTTGLQTHTVSLGDKIPPVVFTLLGVLPRFEGEDLESQLQTIDTFLGMLSPTVRPELGKLLNRAAVLATNETTKDRIKQAADSIASGGRAAEPYDHEAAMQKYRKEHEKNFGKPSG